MGVDFISGKAPSFRKRWDRAVGELATPDLFRQQPTGEARQVQGDLVPGTRLSNGTTLLVRLTDAGMVAYKGNTLAVEFPSPPPEVIAALREASGVALATVEQVGLLGDTVRVSLK